MISLEVMIMQQLLPWLLPLLQEYMYLRIGLNWGERERAPSSEFNGDFYLLLRCRSCLGTSCAWVRVVFGYVRCLGTHELCQRRVHARTCSAIAIAICREVKL